MKYLFLYCLLLFLFHLIRKIYTSCFLYVLVLNIFLQTRGNPTQTIINAFGTCLKFHAELSTYLTFFLPILDPPPPDRGMTLERDPPLKPQPVSPPPCPCRDMGGGWLVGVWGVDLAQVSYPCQGGEGPK